MVTGVEEYFKILEELQKNNTTLPINIQSGESFFDVDLNDRLIIVPPEFKKYIAVQRDHNIETIYFRVDRYFDTTDLSELTCVVQFTNARKESGIHLVSEKDLTTYSSDGKMILGWKLNRDITQYPGTVTYSLRFYKLDENKKFIYDLHTIPAIGIIAPGLDTLEDTNAEEDTKPVANLITDLINRVDYACGPEMNGMMKNNINEYFAENPVKEEIRDYLTENPFDATEQIEEYLGKISLFFDTFPTDEVIATIPFNSEFTTKGFYSKYDGGGCKYGVTNYCNNGIKIGDRYIRAIDEKDTGIIDVTKYGVMQSNSSKFDNDIATRNITAVNKIISRIILNTTLYFPAGQYFFNAPISTKNSNVRFNILGQCPIGLSTDLTDRGVTTFYFSGLQEGDSAVYGTFNAISNIKLISTDYDMTFTRDNIYNGEEVAAEIFTNKVTGINATKQIAIENVLIIGFYTGIYCVTANTSIVNVNIRKCHNGISVGNDTKLLHIHFFYVYIGLIIRGSLTSANQVRGDSIAEHLINIIAGNSIQIHDIDCDWSLKSAILLGNNVNYNTVNRLYINGLHARSGIKNLYNIDNENEKSMIDVETNEDMTITPIISVSSKTKLQSAIINTMNDGSLPTIDSNSKTSWYTPIGILGGGTETMIINVLINNASEIFDLTKEYADKVFKSLSTNSGVNSSVQVQNGLGSLYITKTGSVTKYHKNTLAEIG